MDGDFDGAALADKRIKTWATELSALQSVQQTTKAPKGVSLRLVEGVLPSLLV